MSEILNKIYEIFELNAKHTTPKGWMMTKKKCPFCHKDDYHFGMRLNTNKSYKNLLVFNCFKCQETGTEYKLLLKLGFENLLKANGFTGQVNLVENHLIIPNIKEKVTDLSLMTKAEPIGWKRVYENEYLDGRGFEPWQYKTYMIGTCPKFSMLRDYVVFLITQDGENKGYIARSIHSKEYIKEQELLGKMILRYRNQSGVDFNKLLFGIDEVTEKTHTVILVEGITDKTNVDKLLQLNLDESIKCLCTFGKKISKNQIEQLRLKNINQIIMLYDPDALEEQKKFSFELQKYFKVRAGYLSDKDPGDLNLDEIVEVFNNLQDPSRFSINFILKKEL